MRAALLLVLPLACSRREPPAATGGGPRELVIAPDAARTELARARCSVAVTCGDLLEMDACVTREEASVHLECDSIDRRRLDVCVERTRARACGDEPALPECATEILCAKEEPR